MCQIHSYCDVERHGPAVTVFLELEKQYNAVDRDADADVRSRPWTRAARLADARARLDDLPPLDAAGAAERQRHYDDIGRNNAADAAWGHD